MPPNSRPLLLVVPLALAACASLPAERGRVELNQLTSPHLPELPAWHVNHSNDLAERLRHPLDADTAVAMAWSESPRIRSVLADLGPAAAERFEAGRLRNLRLGVGRMGDERSVGLNLVISDLLTLPARNRSGQARWQTALAEAAQTLLDEAAATRADYYHYVAANQIAGLRDAVAEAADISAELARRLRAAGNISALQLAREEAAATIARTHAAQARANRFAARMALAERMGLAGRSNRWRTQPSLSLPPAQDPSLDVLLTQAQGQRPELLAARAAFAAGEHELALTRATRFLGEIEFGFEREHEHGQRTSGPHLSLALPLFQQGQAGLVRAESRHAQARERLSLAELALQRQVRTQHARLSAQRDIIDAYRSALIPQREAIVAGEQERYNFMLIGAFELIAAKQQEYDAYQGYLEAIRDYWLTRSELARSVGGTLPGDDYIDPQPAPSLEEILAPPAGTDHSHHHHHGGTP